MMRRFGLPLICLLVAAGCIRLGIWQVRRLKERRAHNAELLSRMTQIPLDLDGPLPDSLTWRHATARGIYDFDHEILVTDRTQGGLPGVYVVTPLRLGSGRVVLVERGWLYSPDGRSANLQQTREPAESTVRGVVTDVPARGSGAPRSPNDSVWPRTVRSLDLGDLTFNYAPITAVLRRDSLAAPTSGAFQAIPAPALDDGPHLSYAIQWFSFATIALVGGGVWLTRKRGILDEGQRAGDPV
ncbi:MAG TPA: SURF1 family protein [Gemmatimonadales bacterium]|jgi:surfeit locus 1 family protein